MNSLGFVKEDNKTVRFTEFENEYISHVSQKFNTVYLLRKCDCNCLIIFMDKMQVLDTENDKTYSLVVFP